MAKNRMYQLYELRDEIKKAIVNSTMVEDSQKKLVQVLIESKHDAEFQDFIKGMTQDWKQYDHDRLVLKERLEKVEKVISMYEKKDEKSEIVIEVVATVLEALGIAKAESKVDA